MRLTTHSHHTRYEENGSEGKFSLRMPRRKSSVFKPPVLIQFQVTADNGYTLEAIQEDYPHIDRQTLSVAIDEAIDALNTTLGFDHGVGHPLLLLYDAKTPRGQKVKEFNGLGNNPFNASVSLF